MLNQIKESSVFRFKNFVVRQDICPMKVNTDGVLLGAWSETDDASRALDIGTGTGVIALMLAQKSTNLLIDAIDIEEKAFQQASENFEINDIGVNITAYQQGLQDFAARTTTMYDLIVSNPPFFTGGTFSYNENKAHVRHTIKLSHSDLLQSVRKLLDKEGFFDVILPYSEGIRFIQIAEQYGFFLHRKTEVYSRPHKNIERLLIRLSKQKPLNAQTDTLCLMNAENQSYSEAYKLLTKDYYLAF